MSVSWRLPLWIAFLVLCPVLDIGGHFIYVPELCLYAWFLGSLLLRGGARVRKAVPEQAGVRHFVRKMGRAQFIYAGLFLAAAAFAAWLTGQKINNYDVFVLRQVLQVALCVKLFGDQARKLAASGRFDRALFRALVILCIPALIVYLQRLDLFSMRAVVVALYKPQFFFLRQETFDAYRYTSVFKDFFTAAVYFTMLAALLFQFSLRTRLGAAHRIALIGMLAFVYGAQLFVARTSLIMIPFVMTALAVFGAPLRSGVLLKRVLPAAALAGVLAAIALPVMLGGGLVNARWVMEGISVFTPEEREKVSSFTMMQRWYAEMFEQAFEGEFSLLVPHHAYDLTERADPGLYTDSFYGQELYRYGLYGGVAYLAYLAMMALAAARGSRLTLILTAALAVMNYKGGNTFFMPKDIYLFALILAMAPYLEHRRLTAWRASRSSPPSSHIPLSAAA